MSQTTSAPREGGGEALETTTVLVVAPGDLSAELGLTALWREEVRRVMVSTVDVAVEVARVQRPKLIVVGGAPLEATAQAVCELRAHRASRATAIVALSASSGFEEEEALLAAGANVVLPVPVDPAVWDGRLEELLHVPRRRAARVPVRFRVWSRGGEVAVADGLALNLSVHGILLESKDPIEVGTTVDLSFMLEDQPRELRALGQAVRQAGTEDGRPRTGIEFLVLRGDARPRLAAFVDGRAARGHRKNGPAECPETSEWESELRAREAHKAAILESSLDAIVTVDHEGRVREFNRAAERMFGYARAEVIGRPMARTLVAPARRDRWKQWLLREASLARTEAIHHRLEAVAQRADGVEFPVELTVSALTLKGRTLLTFSMRDLTERNRVEQALACDHSVTRILSESDTIAAAAPRILEVLGRTHGWDLGAFWVAENGTAARCVDVWASEETEAPGLKALDRGVAVARAQGLTGEAWNRRRPLWISQLPAWSDHLRTRVAMSDGFRSGLLVPLLRGTECLGVIELFSRERRPEDAEVLVRIASLGSQVAQFLERRRAEKALRGSEERFRALVENSTDATALVDPSGTFGFVSASVGRVLGYAPETLCGRNGFELVHPEEVARARAGLEGCVANPGQAVTASLHCRHHDGSWRELEWVAVSHLDNPAIGAVVANFRDVTERRRAEQERQNLEAQLRQSQKIEAVGRLAGGVAHDFNNLLAVILGYANLALARTDDADAVRRHLEQIRRSSDRAAALTRQLLAFSRRQVLVPEVLDLGRVVQDLQGMLGRVIGEDVELATRVAPDAGRVKADPGQVEQVIMNLTVNARDAMPSGGRLSLAVANVDLDETFVHENVGSRSGAHVVLEVADTGVGMDESVRSRVFEPFFTTKEVGKGTGLGLATVYGIVKQSGGYVTVDSAPGNGTTFRIYLPRVDDPAPAPGPSEDPDVRGGTETILFVEDDAAVRGLVREILAGYGYRVLEAGGGAEALRIARAHPEPIALLLTDVVMPGMSGSALADLARALRPGLRVLYASGYTDDALVRHGTTGLGDFIQKPFAPEALARRVREVLDRRLS